MDARQVQHLRLRSATPAGAQRARILIEDALRTAPLPGLPESSLVFIRSLALGPVDLRRSPAGLELQIEARLRELCPHAIHAAAPGAGAHPLVYFRDPPEAVALFIRRLARADPLREWFWPRVIPGFTATTGAPAGEGLRLALAAALRLPPAPAVAAAAVLDEVLAHSPAALDALLAALSPADGAALLAACGWSTPPPLATRHSPPSPPHPLPPGWGAVLARHGAQWGAHAPLLAWLAGLALTVHNPALAADPNLPARALLLSAPPPLPLPLPLRPPAGERPPAGVRVTPPPHFAPPLGGPPPFPAFPPGAAAAQTPAQPGAQPPAALRLRPPRRPAARPALVPDGSLRAYPAPTPAASATHRGASPLPASGAFSAWCGLYFLLPALMRLGLPAWLAANPALAAHNLPGRILRLAARRAGAAANDPILAPLAAPRPPRGEPFALPFCAPLAWQALLPANPPAACLTYAGQTRLTARPGLTLALWSGEPGAEIRAWLARCGDPPNTPAPGAKRPAGAVETTLLKVVLRAWLAAARLWLHQQTGLGLAQLLRRPGRVLATRTHLTLTLPLATVDLRLRKAGLDLNPGWLPWFGRVVTFEYAGEVT